MILYTSVISEYFVTCHYRVNIDNITRSYTLATERQLKPHYEFCVQSAINCNPCGVLCNVSIG